MRVTQISLQAFRSYSSQQFLFDAPTTVIVGPNAVGKTSIIEAIHLMVGGSSFRASKIEEMIQFGQELSRVRGVVEDADGEITELEVLLTRGIVQGKRTQKRLFSVNEVRRRRRDFVGKLLAVVFRPEDMRLIEGSPSRRRHFLDSPLATLNPQYDIALSTYEKALRQTNKLMEQIKDRRAPLSTLHYWNQTMLKYGMLLQEQRRQFISYINSVPFSLPLTIHYQPSLLTEERQQQYQERAIAAGHVLIGPHKDDFIVTMVTDKVDAPDSFDMALYGSRGQQRMVVLWLKMAEQAFLKSKTGQQPLLLLDDILSELDPEVRAKVLALVHGGQAIITSADETILPEISQIVPQAKILQL